MKSFSNGAFWSLLSIVAFLCYVSVLADNTNHPLMNQRFDERRLVPVELGQQCNKESPKSHVRAYCVGHGVDVNCDRVTGYCVCKPGHVPDENSKSCRAKNRQLSDPCDQDADCQVAYSSCKNSKCQCTDDFSEKNGTCIPTDGYYCPEGEPLPNTEGTGIRGCSTLYGRKKSQQGDTCPDGYACFLHLHSISSATGQHAGHCCPGSKVKTPCVNQVCPVGKPLSNGTCPDLSRVPQDARYHGEPRTCPHGSHDCLGSLCCPSPCRGSNSHHQIDGKCYPRVLKGQPCEIDAQCVKPSWTCRNRDATGPKVCQ